MKIIHGSARFSTEGPHDKAMITVSRGSFEEILAPGEAEHNNCLWGKYGNIAPYAEPDLEKADLIKIAKARREERIMAGVTVDIGGGVMVEVRTDDVGERRLQSALSLAEMTPDEMTPWASPSGTVLLSLAALRAVAQAAFSHGQSAYAAYGAYTAAIEAGTITKASQITFE